MAHRVRTAHEAPAVQVQPDRSCGRLPAGSRGEPLRGTTPVTKVNMQVTKSMSVSLRCSDRRVCSGSPNHPNTAGRFGEEPTAQSFPGDTEIVPLVPGEDGTFFFVFPATLKTGWVLFDQNQKGQKRKDRVLTVC